MRCDRKGVTTGVWRNERVERRKKHKEEGREGREKMKNRLRIRSH